MSEKLNPAFFHVFIFRSVTLPGPSQVSPPPFRPSLCLPRRTAFLCYCLEIWEHMPRYPYTNGISKLENKLVNSVAGSC